MIDRLRFLIFRAIKLIINVYPFLKLSKVHAIHYVFIMMIEVMFLRVVII